MTEGDVSPPDEEARNKEDVGKLYGNVTRIGDLLYQHLINLVKAACKERYGCYLTPDRAYLTILHMEAMYAVAELTYQTERTISVEVGVQMRDPVQLDVTVTRSFALDLLARGEVAPVEDPVFGVRQLYPCIRRGCPHWRPEDDENVAGLDPASCSFFRPLTSPSDECRICGHLLKLGDRAYSPGRQSDGYYLESFRARYAHCVQEGDSRTADSLQRNIDEILRDQQMYLRPEPVYATLAELSSRPAAAASEPATTNQSWEIQATCPAGVTGAVAGEPQTGSADLPLSPVPADTVIGTDADGGEPVTLPYKSRDLGVTVLGQTGYGKTTLLEQLILHDIAAGTAVIVVDAHGDLTGRILSLAEAAEEDLWLLEAWEDAPFRLHLFDCPDPASSIAVDRTVSGIVQVFKKLFGSPREFYPRLERDLGNAARTVIANRGTLLDVPRLFWDAEFRTAALAGVTDRQVHEFWARWERLGRPDRQLDQLEATINRLDQFLSSEFVAAVVGSPTTTIPFDQVLAGDGRVLLVNLPVGEIGEGLCNLLGALFLAVLTERIFARGKRAPAERPRVHLYLDEYGRYATPTTAQLLTEGRKFGVGTTIAHQTRAQIPDEENRAAELQTGALVCFQLIGADAAELAGEFHLSPEPQWEEPVEEIEGEEPELAVPPNPVDHLINSGHPDPVVRETVRTFLTPLVRQNRVSESFRQALVDALEQRITDTPTTMLRVLCTYWPKFARYFLPSLRTCPAAVAELNVPPSPLESAFVYRDSPEEQMRWEDHMYHCVRDFIRAADGIIVVGGDPTNGPHEGHLAEELQKIFCWYRSHRPNNDPSTGQSLIRLGITPNFGSRKEAFLCIAEEDPDPKEWVDTFLPPLGEFVYPMLILLHRLAQEPLLVPTGRHRPRKRIRYITHPQRSYQDVHNELAVQLASLPRFTAYTSVHGDQHRVALSPPAAGEIDEARIARIRRASKARFGRPPEPPQPSSPAPPPTGGGPPPPISRYHADEPEL